MKIIVPDRHLLEKLTSLLRSVPKNGNFRFVADKNKLNVYTEHSSGWAKGVIGNIDIIEEGEIAAPIAIIPILINANYPVELTKGTSLNIKYKGSGPRGINLNLMGDPEMIGINPTVPKWMESVEELKNTTYLMGTDNSRIWITDSAIAVGDSFRFSVFKKNLEVKPFIIEPYLLQKHYDFREGIDFFSDEKHVWFGNDGYYITLCKTESSIPDKLIELIQSEPTYEFLCVVDRELLAKAIATSKLFLKDDGPPSIGINFQDKTIRITTSGSTNGNGNPEVEAITINGEQELKVNINYLSQAINVCRNRHIVISNLVLGSLTLLVIKDEEMFHYIVPMF